MTIRSLAQSLLSHPVMSETADIVTPEARAEIVAYLADLDRRHPMGAIDPDDEEGQSMDVRLQIHEDGMWSIHVGDPSYDQDHRGFWGSTSVPWLESDDSYSPEEVADELISECEDHAAQ